MKSFENEELFNCKLQLSIEVKTHPKKEEKKNISISFNHFKNQANFGTYYNYFSTFLPKNFKLQFKNFSIQESKKFVKMLGSLFDFSPFFQTDPHRYQKLTELLIRKLPLQHLV